MMTQKTRRGITALISLTAISFWISHQQADETLVPVAGLDPKLNYVLRDFELQFYDENGLPTINMRSPLLRNNPELQVGTIEKPVIKLIQADAVWNLTSDSATVTADKEYVLLSGKVHVQRLELNSGNRIEIDTREVRIKVTPQTASTNQAVSMFDGYNQVNAIGLDLDMKTSTFKLQQQVKATYAVH